MSNPPSSPTQPLSRDRILHTALHLVDNGGIAALSMRKLAEALGVKAMSLYNHVANKDDILDGIIDRVIGEIDLPPRDTDWQTAMRHRACSAHRVLMRHPWAASEIMARVNVGPAMLRYIDATLGCLRAAGFSFELADQAWNAIDSHIYGFTLQALNFPFEAADYATAAEQYLAMIPPEQYPHMNALTHQVIAGQYDGIHSFEFGLDLILQGLETLRQTAP
ncbi:TetR/AcrR family transcriptional regulator [Spirulina major]|uniref:TetR/AcrR family transcriptional regulator n=1 Tax=Spirulina major TaxID=270636 RepID=UPI0009328667|nr:TetR/AcrR family transcriptional regulator [Spirulina major]